MPTSQPYQLSQVVQLLLLFQPTRLIDVGVGFGKYGVLAREYLDIYCQGRLDRSAWKVRIDGIEGFAGYITPVQKYIYDQIYIGEALEVLSGLTERYDLMLMIDVLEHYDLERGQAFLREATKKCRNILLSTPVDMHEQGGDHGNDYEIHRHEWVREDFKAYPEVSFLSNRFSLVTLIGPDAARVAALYRSEATKELLSRWPRIYRGLKSVRKLLGGAG